MNYAGNRRRGGCGGVGIPEAQAEDQRPHHGAEPGQRRPPDPSREGNDAGAPDPAATAPPAMVGLMVGPIFQMKLISFMQNYDDDDLYARKGNETNQHNYWSTEGTTGHSRTWSTPSATSERVKSSLCVQGEEVRFPPPQVAAQAVQVPPQTKLL